MNGLDDLKTIIAKRQRELAMSDRQLSAEAGLGHAAVWHMKHKAKDVSLTAAIALLNAVGLKVTTTRRD